MFRRAPLILLALALAACQPATPPLQGTGMDMFAPTKLRIHPLSRILIPTAPPEPVASATTPLIPSPTSAPATSPAIPNPATSSPGIGGGAIPGPAPALPAAILEARLEFSDQFGDTTKGVGTITLQLFDLLPNALIPKGPRLASWSFPLESPETNRDHWDRMTRTYLFRIPLTEPLPPRDHLLLRATLTLPNGAQLSDELPLPTK